MKVARTVLNGESGSNAADLHNRKLVNFSWENLDFHGSNFILKNNRRNSKFRFKNNPL